MSMDLALFFATWGPNDEKLWEAFEKDLDGIVAAAVQAERERVTKLACEHCRAGHPMSMKHPMTHHDVPIPRRSRGYMMASCKAEAIRARTGQGEGE